MGYEITIFDGSDGIVGVWQHRDAQDLSSRIENLLEYEPTWHAQVRWYDNETPLMEN